MKSIKITDYKTKRINTYTGGFIGVYQIERASLGDDFGGGMLPNSFLFLHEEKEHYMGAYEEGWWYFKNNLLVCLAKPHGVAYRLKESAVNYPYLDEYKETNKIRPEYLEGMYGYTRRGGSTFKIGDRFFDEKYEPKEEDYLPEEWADIMERYENYIQRELKEGYIKTIEEGKIKLPISDVVNFRLRGNKIIETWDEATQAAINMSHYLS